MFSSTKDKDLAWKLIATLAGPKGNVEWNKKIGALPIYKSAEKDPFYADPKFRGWFAELADPNVTPTVMPTYLEEFAFFKDSLAIKTSQQALDTYRPVFDAFLAHFTKAAQDRYSAQWAREEGRRAAQQDHQPRNIRVTCHQ